MMPNSSMDQYKSELIVLVKLAAPEFWYGGIWYA